MEWTELPHELWPIVLRKATAGDALALTGTCRALWKQREIVRRVTARLLRHISDGSAKEVADALAAGPLVNFVDSRGYTPLFCAMFVAVGNRSLFDETCTAKMCALLAAGADPDLPNSEGAHAGWTPLRLAVRMNKPGMVRLLLDHGACPHPIELHSAVSGSSAEIVRDLLEHGANVNATQHNTTPLISAIWYNRHTHSKHEACHEPACHIERMLVAAGGRLGAGLPLHDAAHFGSVRVVQALLSNGADVHAMDAAGWTPLHMAAAHGRAGIIRALVAAGADVHVEDGEGKTPKARARLCSQTTLWGASVAWYADAIAELVAAGDTD